MTGDPHGPHGPDDGPDDVPRLPRGRGLKLSRPQLVRIAGTLILLVFIVVMQRPCARSVSKFVTGFGSDGSAAPALPKPGSVDVPAAGPGSAASGAAELPLDRYEQLRPGMTDDEVKAVIERARAKAANGGAGSAIGSDAAGHGP